MQDLLSYLRQEVQKVLKAYTKANFVDKGLSGLHLASPPLLLKGLRLDAEDLPNLLIETNRILHQDPIVVQLRDGKRLAIHALDLVVTGRGSVYLADVIDGSFI